MLSCNFKKIINIIWQSALISIIVILLVCPLSCCVSAEGIKIIRGEADSPKLEKFTVIDNKHMKFNFSENVILKDVTIVSKDIFEKLKNLENNYSKESEVEDSMFDESENISILENNSIYYSNSPTENKGEIIVEFSESTEIGNSYVITGVVEDKNGNTLVFSLPFSGYNNKIPLMAITEVLPEYGLASKKDNTYRCEYVKLKALEDGNLFGLVIGSATNKKEKDYYFPAIKIAKGEEVIVHFRKKGNGCISEMENNLNLSTAPHSGRNIRDLWLENTESAFSDDYDVIYLRDNINNNYMDGFMYINTKNKSEWSDIINDKVQELVSAGIFSTGDITEACEERLVTPKNVFFRKKIPEVLNNKAEETDGLDSSNNTNRQFKFSKEDWTIVKKS